MGESSLSAVQVKRNQGDGLAQAHVVGEARPQPCTGELGEPGEAVPLVVAQLRRQTARAVQRRHHRGVHDSVAHLQQRRTWVHLDLLAVELHRPGERRPQGHDGWDGLLALLDALSGTPSHQRVDDHPVVAQPDHRSRGLGQRGHLVVGERVVTESEPPVELEECSRPEEAVHQRPLLGPGRHLDPGLRDQLASQPPGPEHVDAGGVEGREPAFEQVRELVGVENDPVGYLLPLQPVQGRPDRRGPAQGGAEVEPGSAREPVVLGQPEPVGIDDVGVVVHLVCLEHDDHATALEHLARRLDPQADPDLVGEVCVLGIPGLTLEPVEAATSHGWSNRHLGRPRHRVGHRVEQLPDQVLGVVDRRVAVGAGARQGPEPIVVIGLQRPDAPGVAGLREADPPGRDQLHRQQRGAAEQADRGVCVVDPDRPGEHRDGATHRHPDGARRSGELDLAQPRRVARDPGGAALQRYEAQRPARLPCLPLPKLAGGPDSPAIPVRRLAAGRWDQSSSPRIALATRCGTLSSKTLGMM